MKELLIASLCCLFIAGVTYAGDLAREQAKALGRIITQMDAHKDDPVKTEQLEKQKRCIENSRSKNDLAACINLYSGAMHTSN